MTNSLSDLPPELLTKIIEELALLYDESRQTQNDQISYGREYVKRPQHLDSLRFRYIHHIPWSSTSMSFRHLLAPYIFASVELRNENKCGASLNALATGQHAHLIKEINYYGSAPSNSKKESESRDSPDNAEKSQQNAGSVLVKGLDVNESASSFMDGTSESKSFWKVAGILPESVEMVLSNLQRFPCLELLTIEFSYTLYDLPEGMDLCSEEETKEQIEADEETQAWRALMAKTYDALANNKEIYAKSLELRDLIYKRPSTFTNQSFHDFLGHIEKFSLSLRGEDNGAGWKTNRAEEYSAFASKLDMFFFNHLSQVTSVTIKASKEGPLGLPSANSWSLVPLALEKNQMPYLKELHLEYIVLCPQLTDFLIGHTATLERLSMHHCFVETIGTMTEEDLSWDRLFNSLYDAGFSKLRQVEILPLDLPLLVGAYIQDYETRTRDKNDILHITNQILLDSDPGRRLFAYTIVDDKYGMLFPNEEEILNSLRNGKDQVSYDRLMQKVDAIAANDDVQ